MTDEHLVTRLVARAQAGDVEAVGALYDHYVERIFRFVRFRLGNQLDAEDVSQRVFLQMIEALPRYRSRGIPFGGWLFRVARNAVIDHGRTHRLHEPLEGMADMDSGQRSPEELAITAAEMQRVASALGALTDDQREVITLRFMAELSPAEIAAVLGRRQGAIRATQFRALQNLRELLGDDEPGGAALAEAVSD
jgi:RNA polymerase sigma-70 factor (ECF subfamily)